MTLDMSDLRLLTRTLPCKSCSASPVWIMLVRISAAALFYSLSCCEAASRSSSSSIRDDYSRSSMALSSSASSWPAMLTCLRRRLLPALRR